MKASTRVKRFLIVVISVCLILITGSFLINSIIEKRIRQEFAKMPAELRLKFSSVHANVLLATVSLDSVDASFIPYSSLPQNEHHFRVQQVSLKGISFLKFLFNKQLNTNLISFQNGKIELDSFLFVHRDSLQSTLFDQIKSPFKKLFVGNLYLHNTTISMTGGPSEPIVRKADINFGGVRINKVGDAPDFGTIEMHLSDVNYSSNDYSIKVAEINLSSSQKTLALHFLELNSTKLNRNEANISSLQMEGFDVFGLIYQRKIETKRLRIEAKKVWFVTGCAPASRSFPIQFSSISIGHFESTASTILIEDGNNSYRMTGNASIDELKLDSPIEASQPRFESISADLKDIRYAGANYQTAVIEQIKIDSKKNRISLQKINIIPALDKFEYQKKLLHQADWMKASISAVEIERPDFKKLLNQKIFAEKILVGPSQVYIFRDRRLPRQQKAIPLPVDFLKSLSIDIRIRNCQLAASNVEYEEYPKSGYGLTGMLKIENAKATISSLINHPLPGDPSNVTISIQGSIMGSGTAHGTVLMPLQKNQPYKISGQFDNLELTKLNSSSENLGKIRIKSGFLDFLYFDFTMTEQRSTGKIIGAYHHLIIQPLKKHTEEKSVADMASFALRHGIIPLNKDSSLPAKKRTGFVDYKRDPTRMVSYYYLQSLLMGIKKSFKLGFLLPK